MIITNIIGGIGNQMFQYAAGRSLALNNDAQLFLDVNDFKSYYLHNGFELNRVFNISANLATPDSINYFIPLSSVRIIKKYILKIPFNFFKYKGVAFNLSSKYFPKFDKLGVNTYLFGYWQSEKYFKIWENEIRNDFKFRDDLHGLNHQISLSMKKSQSVSLHIRRGDYITNSKTQSVMETCSLDYYLRAINCIQSQIHNPLFFIFSNDIEWAKKNLHLNYNFVYIDHNHGPNSYRDMHLMSLCKHHIIANSSFSWWGAWLNPSPQKIVIAPKVWFRNNSEDDDLIPEDWVRL